MLEPNKVPLRTKLPDLRLLARWDCQRQASRPVSTGRFFAKPNRIHDIVVKLRSISDAAELETLLINPGETVQLKGMTWDHSRGIDGLLALDKELQDTFGVSIDWQSRSLLAFGDQHISSFASEFDFLVIDHPHVPDAADSSSILALDHWLPSATIDQLSLESVGDSHDSYAYRGNIWAFGIDAAAQVSAYRLGGNAPPPYWADVLEDAKEGKVLWPYKPVDAFSTFATMMAQLGSPLLTPGNTLHKKTAREVFSFLIELASHVPNECAEYNPIDVAEILSTTRDFDYSPALYGYTNYSRVGFRENLLQYSDVVSFDGRATGSQMGGAGIAVSSSSKHPELASQVAAFLALAPAQMGAYTVGGGQPGNLRAWLSPELNELTNNFFRYTLRTLENAWVRPRILGYPDYQLAFSLVVSEALTARKFTEATLNELESLSDVHLREAF